MKNKKWVFLLEKEKLQCKRKLIILIFAGMFFILSSFLTIGSIIFFTSEESEPTSGVFAGLDLVVMVAVILRSTEVSRAGLPHTTAHSPKRCTLAGAETVIIGVLLSGRILSHLLILAYRFF